jgi:hypothetical protein
MKKILMVAAAITLTMAMSSCSQNHQQDAEQQSGSIAACQGQLGMDEAEQTHAEVYRLLEQQAKKNGENVSPSLLIYTSNIVYAKIDRNQYDEAETWLTKAENMLKQLDQPADIATRMNDELAEGNDRNMFVTMFIGLLHLDTGRLDFCNCGHNPPILDADFLLMKHVNQMIGFMGDITFVGETIDDIRGKQLLIYTDGLNEAENSEKEQFGDKRIQKLMADSTNLSSRQLVNMLKKAVQEHRAGTEPNDDLTLMCISLKA